MPARRFAATMLTTTQWTGLYTVPAGMEVVATVAFVNHDSTNQATVWLAITDEANPANTRPEEMVLSGAVVDPGRDRQFKTVVAAENLTISARTDLPNMVSVIVYGFEETP